MTALAAEHKVGLDYKRLLLGLLQEIANCESIESACIKFDEFMRSFGGQLLSVKFYDSKNESPEIRPFSAYPDAVRKFRNQFTQVGGCPLNREAVKRLRPFSYTTIDRSYYNSLQERRLFRELDKIGHETIAIVPIVCGRGVAVITVGLHNQPFEGPLRMSVSDSVAHVVAAVMARFPEVSTLFDKKVLSSQEREILALACGGMSFETIGAKLRLSSRAVNSFVDSASRKLGAANIPETIYRAISLGEISQIGSKTVTDDGASAAEPSPDY